MIFAELNYPQHYSEVHQELVEFIRLKYPKLESGLQGDSWIWVYDEQCKVAINTFTSMKHQIKCDTEHCSLLAELMQYLANHYQLNIYSAPQWEAHE